MNEDLNVKLVILGALFLLFVGTPVLFYLCARAASIGKLSGERWFWVRHAEKAAEIEKIIARKEREEDDE